MAKGNEAIRVAMDLALQGNHHDAEQDFSNALKCYETSIEKLIPIVEGQETRSWHYNRSCCSRIGERDVIRKKVLTAEVSLFTYFSLYFNLSSTGCYVFEKSRRIEDYNKKG